MIQEQYSLEMRRREEEWLARGSLYKRIIQAAQTRLDADQQVERRSVHDSHEILLQTVALQSPAGLNEVLTLEKKLLDYGPTSPLSKKQIWVESHIIAPSTNSSQRLFIIAFNPDAVSLTDDEASVRGLGGMGGFHTLSEWENLLSSIQQWSVVQPQSISLPDNDIRQDSAVSA